jgi:hypothetical protein
MRVDGVTGGHDEQALALRGFEKSVLDLMLMPVVILRCA